MIIIKKNKCLTVLLLAGVFFISCNQNNSLFTKLNGPYLGQTPPGMTAEIFAPGIISTGFHEVCISFSLDAKEMFYSIAGSPFSVTFFTKEENGRWTVPEVAPFSGKYSSEFLITPDGDKIFLTSGAPFDEKGPPKSNWNLWIANKLNGNWGKAEPSEFKAFGSDEFTIAHPSLSANGNLYFFSAEYPGSLGNDGDILLSKQMNPDNIKILNDSINSVNWDIDPFIAPDESYLIFSSNRSEGSGGNDLYISFRNEDGTWNSAKNMGDAINSSYNEVHPSVSLDGKYLFFCSNRHFHKKYAETQLSYKRKMEILNSPANGNEDIYWVDAKVIEELRLEK